MAAPVTVVTGTIHGREQMLAECKASVAAQTVPVEHIVELDDHWNGIAAVYNKLFWMVRTEWVVTLADDDLLDPDFAETLLAAVEEHPGFDVYYPWMRSEGRNGWHTNRPYDGTLDGACVNGLIRADLAKRVGYRQTALACNGQGGEDGDFWRRMHEAGATFHCVEKVLWTQRFHGGNTSLGAIRGG